MSKKNVLKEYVIAPGETILELLEVNNMTQLDLSDKTGIHKKTINEIIKGKAPITTATALKLEYVFNIPASFWNNLESSYRESLERVKDIESIVEDEALLSKFPYNEMSKRNWDYIVETRDPSEKVRSLRRFFSVASLSFDTELKRQLSFRKSNNENFSRDYLYCWLRYGEIQANKENNPKFDIDKLKESSKSIRKLATNSFLLQIDFIKKFLNEAGVSLIFEPYLTNTYVNGVSYKMSNDKAVIMLSDRGKKDDILWFTLFHEIAHLVKHSKKEIYVDLENAETNDIENEADEYARNILIPPEKYNNFINNRKIFTESMIKDFAKENGVSTGIVVGRLQKDKKVGWSQFGSLITRI